MTFAIDQLTLQSPEYLWIILAVPLLWWLLRLIPPEAIRRRFPSLNLFQSLPPLRAQTAFTPLWLLALRGFIIIALTLFFTEPVWQTGQTKLPPVDQPVILLMDNCWAAAPNWERMKSKSLSILASLPVEQNIAVIAACPENNNYVITQGLVNTPQARLALAQLQRRDQSPDWAQAAVAMRNLDLAPIALMNFISSGVMESNNVPDMLLKELRVYDDVNIALPPPENLPVQLTASRSLSGIDADVTRLNFGKSTSYQLTMRGLNQRMISLSSFSFPDNEKQLSLKLKISPDEMNEIRSVAIDQMGMTAHKTLQPPALPPRIGMVDTGQVNDLNQPSHYIVDALSGETEIIQENWEVLLSQNLPVIIATNPVLPPEYLGKITDWINQGGRLIRFAADTQPPADHLMPARILRTVSMATDPLFFNEPARLGPMPDNTPLKTNKLSAGNFNFYWMAAPESIADAEIWANYTNSAPAVLARHNGEGKTILVTSQPAPAAGNWMIQAGFSEFMQSLIAETPKVENEKSITVNFDELITLDAGNLPENALLTDFADRNSDIAIAPYLLALIILLFIIDQALIIVRFAGMAWRRP